MVSLEVRRAGDAAASRRHDRSVWLAIYALVAATACFQPHYDEPQCSAAQTCPGELVCHPDGICRSPGTPVDAAAVDATDDDGAAIDATTDGDARDIDARDAPDPFCISTGLQACFRMNQSSGAPIDGHSPPITIARADATNYVAGCRGNSLDLGVDVFVRTGAPATAITDLTAEAWVKLNTVPTVADGRRYWLTAENSWSLSYATDVGGNVNVRCLIVISASNLPTVSATLPNPTQWNHVACTWDTSRLRLFINGLLTEVNPSDDPIVKGNAGIQIGRDAVDGDAEGSTQGQMDDVRVWSRRVPNGEIQATAAAGCQ